MSRLDSVGTHNVMWYACDKQDLAPSNLLNINTKGRGITKRWEMNQIAIRLIAPFAGMYDEPK